ncbi:conserved exported protein of unknown function [Tenacibaculum sp. 190130A14a]|uniref:Conjugal transfer protein n=1 Tax=Tenacibaculum polynesiense TaxID=3137857 RepID=A0ABP1F727_9FLAO
MNKYIITLLFALICSTLNAQQQLDTIYANEHKNVALFFPKPIRQGITGASHFVFTYNREKEQYFGLLQAQPGTDSNLLTVTNDGRIYSYILRYRRNLPKLNYFVGDMESIGNEMRKTIKEKPGILPISEERKRVSFFEKFSKYLLKLKSENLKTKRKKGLKLRLQKMVYQGDEVYLVLEFSNNSGIDFEIDYLNIYRVNGNKRRKSSYQKLLQKVVYEHELLGMIKNKDSNRFVFVLPKFVLGDNERLEIELQELKGNRKVVLKFN